MTRFKKVLAIGLMVLAVVGMVASLAGLACLWVGKARVTSMTLAALAELEGDLQAVESTLGEVNPHLVAAREGLGTISAVAGGVGDKLGEPRLVGLAQDVQGRLSEIDGVIRDVNDRLRQVEAGVNDLLEGINKLPGVEVPALDVKLLDGVTGLLSDAQSRVQTLADETTGGKVAVTNEMAGVERAVQQVEGDLGVIESSVSEARTDLAASRETLRAWGAQAPGMLRRVAATLTVALIWFALGQVGLFMWMRSVYRSTQPNG
jgi:hypothetical protein